MSEAHRAERRRQIMDGARAAFGRLGYQAATVEVLEAEIGLSRGAIFSYFPTKLDLFVALAEQDRGALLRRWLDGGWQEVVRHTVEDDPEWIGVYMDVSRMLRNDPGLRARWEQLNPELQAELETAFTAMQERGEIRGDLPLETLGRFLGIVLDGIGLQQAAGFGHPIDVEGTIELIRSALAPK